MAPEAVRLRLSGSPPPAGARARWRAFARQHLSLEAEEADRALACMPLELVLAPVDVEALRRALLATGLGGAVEGQRLGYSPCERHPRLLASGTCPSCQERICSACQRLVPGGRCPRCTKKSARWTRFRHLRVALLSIVLLAVSAQTLRDHRRVASWSLPLTLAVHPMEQAGSSEARARAQRMSAAEFEPVVAFLDGEARRHGVRVEPAVLRVELAPAPRSPPPAPPLEPSVLGAVRFSLSFRWWLFWSERREGWAPAHLRLFVRFAVPESGQALPDSVGLSKARAGLVHLFPDEESQGSNLVVVAHELLHTLGAEDKYDAAGQPLAPLGLAEPARQPLYPQEKAEIMSGRIAISADQARVPESLADCVVGPETAGEIGWPAQ